MPPRAIKKVEAKPKPKGTTRGKINKEDDPSKGRKKHSPS